MKHVTFEKRDEARYLCEEGVSMDEACYLCKEVWNMLPLRRGGKGVTSAKRD
jgi:hypothetical protein